MKKTILPRRDIKRVSRFLMTALPVRRVTLFVVCIQLAFFGLKYLLGGNLSYALVSLEKYADTASGIYPSAEGITFLFRMDLQEMVLAMPLTYSQIRVFLLINVVFFLILAPLRMGAMEQYWAITRKQVPVFYQLFQWMVQVKRWAKAVVVELVVNGLPWLVGILCSVPSVYMFYLFYKTTPTVEDLTTQSYALNTGATALAILAVVIAFWVNSLLLPVRYCLAAHPEYSLPKVFRRGWQSCKGFRGQFFRLRLSYILWFAASRITYGAMDFFALPYISMGGMVFLQQAAIARGGEGNTEKDPAPLEP